VVSIRIAGGEGVEVGAGVEGDDVAVAVVEVMYLVVAAEHVDEVEVAVVEEGGVAGADEVHTVFMAFGEGVVAAAGVLYGMACVAEGDKTSSEDYIHGDGSTAATKVRLSALPRLLF
jgi:hypothetical protein